jgi:hypothetical protein
MHLSEKNLYFDFCSLYPAVMKNGEVKILDL